MSNSEMFEEFDDFFFALQNVIKNPNEDDEKVIVLTDRIEELLAQVRSTQLCCIS